MAKKAPTFHKEKKDFIRRMLKSKPSSYAAEMLMAKRIFEKYQNDVDFLSKVKPPSFSIASLFWFQTPDGEKYLRRKYHEFNYKPTYIEKAVDVGEKTGEDIVQPKKRTIRAFLDE